MTRPVALRLTVGNLLSVFLLRAALLCAALLSVCAPASAHVFSATELYMSFSRSEQNFSASMNTNLEAVMAGIDPTVKDTSESPQAAEYDRLRSLPPDQLEAAFAPFRDEFLSGIDFTVDGQRVDAELVSITFREVGDLGKARNTTFEFKGAIPEGGQDFTFAWNPAFGKVMFRTMAPRARTMHIEMIEPGQSSQVLHIDDIKGRTTLDMVLDFIKVGYAHILPYGLDHILFVVGIFLLSTKLRPILTQVTAFTVAHTLTLGLGTAGYINIPPSIVEPLIAASIVYVAVENIISPNLSPWRPVVVFCFGLLHGMGFAGILREFNLPPGDFLVGLLSFNVGVELGQLSVIALCYLTVGIWFGNKPWYRRVIVIPGSLFIGVVGAVWFVQRVSDSFFS